MSRTNNLLIALVCSAVLSAGCASTVLTFDHPSSFDREIRKTHHMALFGLWEISDPVRPDLLCGNSQWTRAETQFGWVGVLSGILTYGLYTPATVKIYCRDFQTRR